jgi:SAM-dependent methyltransferase
MTTSGLPSGSMLTRLRRVFAAFQEKGPRYVVDRVVSRLFGQPMLIRFRESALAHKYLDHLKGIEIGGSAHNPFGLDTINVDYTNSMDTPFKRRERGYCGEALPVDLVAMADALPIRNKSVDFVLSSHVIEHLSDPIGALQEWQRVAKRYVFIIFPNRERTSDHARELTTVDELIDRHEHRTVVSDDPEAHKSVWILSSFMELMAYLRYIVVETQDPDDKVGNGTAVVIRCEP